MKKINWYRKEAIKALVNDAMVVEAFNNSDDYEEFRSQLDLVKLPKIHGDFSTVDLEFAEFEAGQMNTLGLINRLAFPLYNDMMVTYETLKGHNATAEQYVWLDEKLSTTAIGTSLQMAYSELEEDEAEDNEN